MPSDIRGLAGPEDLQNRFFDRGKGVDGEREREREREMGDGMRCGGCPCAKTIVQPSSLGVMFLAPLHPESSPFCNVSIV